MKCYGLSADEIRKKVENITIAVYGLGKMGLPLASLFAERGFCVIGMDNDEEIVTKINAGENTVKEERGLDDLLIRAVKTGNLKALSDPLKASKMADIHIVIVPTLLDENNTPDLSSVEGLMENISHGLEEGDIVITECTMPPGATESFISLLEESGLRCGKEFGLAHCPERTMTGTAIRDISGEYPKIIGGVDKKTNEALEGIYTIINKKGVIKTDIKTAEAVKVFEGIYRDVNIALANELAVYCEKNSIDVQEAFQIANTQPYAHLHDPGPGVGGHCIPVYPYFVMNEKTKLVRLARAVNDSMVDHTIDLIEEGLREENKVIETSTIFVLGLSFRAGVKEVRNSPTVPLIDSLREKNAKVFLYDPLFTKEEIEQYAEYKDKIEDVDCIVLMTDDALFKTYDWKEIRTAVKIIVDTRRMLDADKMESLRFLYYGIGYPR
jgi:nucleotide sugar dehydrogenase